MLWPLPTSLEQTASIIVKKRFASELKKKKRLAESNPKSKKPRKTEFEKWNVILRDKMFQIIGHHFVIELQLNALNHRTGAPLTRKQFIKLLGIDESQLGRWKQERTFIKSENFFAYCLLIANKPISSLVLSANSQILHKALASTFRYLKRKYDPQGIDELLDVKAISQMIWLMRQMTTSPQLVFNPFDPNRLQDQEDVVLAKLADKYKESLTFSRNPSEVELARLHSGFLNSTRHLLTNWGPTYSLFVLGQNKSWEALKEVS